MKVVLCLLSLGGVAAQLPSDTGSRPGSSSDGSGPSSSSDSTDYPTPNPTQYYTTSTGSYGDVGYSGGSGLGGSGSGWDWSYDGDAGWDPSKELWHFRPSWNWDSPYPPEGTTYVEDWGNPPTLEIPSRRSFNFGADKGVSLVGATAEGERADCGWRDWCVHLTFHSSYGVLSDFDAFVLDRYDSADRIYGDGFWYAHEGDEGPPRVFAPMVLGGFTPEERTVLDNISKRKVKDMARRFNETRTTTWTLYPESDEMDVILSFKQLFTLLPGYPDGNLTQSALNSDVINEWGSSDQVLLRVTAKRDGSGATSALMPRVLNFTGSQLFQVEYFSSLEYPQDDDNLTAPAEAMSLDVVFGRRRYGSGLPWNPARPRDACDACNQQVMNHPIVARCLHGNVPESIFQSIYEQSANDLMEWDGDVWEVGDMGAPSNLSYYLNNVVDACFGLRWLLSGQADDGSWSSGSGFPDSGDRQSSSGSSSDLGDAGYGWDATGSGSGRDRYNDGSRWSSEFSEPVYRYDDTGSRWSSWGYKDVGSASTFGDAGSRWSSSGSAGGPDAGDWSSVRDLRAALAIARETDTGIQCFVDSRCPVGSRNFAEAAGRMVVLEHDHAFVRVNFTEPNYRFYIWMALEELGPDGQFTTPELSSDHSPEEIAELVAGAVPNASDYNLAIDVRVFNNSEIIDWVNKFNEWIANYYNLGGSASEASTAWSSYSASTSDDGSSFRFPPAGEDSTSGFSPNVGPNSASEDGSSPDAGQGSIDSGPWWFADPYPVPESQFTVEISVRNVSVVPNILDVFVVSDDSMDNGAPSNMSWDARGSELRFQLSPLNLNAFEYVPPPAYVNLTWNEEISEYPDPYWNGSSPTWDDTDVWGICTECADAYNACDNSTSCSIGVRAFLQDALSPSHFDAFEISDKMDDYNRRPWGADLGPRLRQSASFFNEVGYDIFMNFMVCLSNSACDLDPPRSAYSYSTSEYISVEPTQLQIVPAQSIFFVPSNAANELESIVMKYRGKESVFEWYGSYEGNLEPLNAFISNVMNENNTDEDLWTRIPSGGPSPQLFKVSPFGQYAGDQGIVFNVTFKDNFFIEAEQPRFKAISRDEYNEISSNNWKAIVAANRNQTDESLWDSYPLVTWRKLSNWLYDLGWDPNFSANFMYGGATAEDIPICNQCKDSWTECMSNESCADAMRNDVLERFRGDLYYSTPRSSIDVSASLAAWKASADSEVYASVLSFLSCLSAESCPVGYALPSDPVAPLVPVTTKLVSHFAVNLPAGGSVVAFLKGNQFDSPPQLSSANNIESWLRSITDGESDLKVQASVNGSFIRYDITIYPAVKEIPVFYSKEDQTYFEIEEANTFASFQLSSNLVQRGQSVSWNLLYYWFGLSAESSRMFSYSGDIFSGMQVCHGCPECWEALKRCQNDPDCLNSTRNVLVPLLRNATLPLLTSTRDDGRTQVKLDLSSALLSLKNDAFQSREGWLAFAYLIHAMSSCGCEVGFGQSNSQMMYLEPTRVQIDSQVVELSVRLYTDTQLFVSIDRNSYSFHAEGSNSAADTARNFLGWFTSTTKSEPFYLGVDHIGTSVENMSESATLTMKLYGLYDVASDSKPLVNPSWIPTFIVTSDDVSVEPPAEVNVTPWRISLQSVDRYPPFDRLLDLLEYGAVSDEIPSSYSSTGSSWGTSTSGSYAGGDECTRCADLRKACFDDEECRSVASNQLMLTLQSSESSDNLDDGYWYSMSSQILDGVFNGMQSRKKLLELLTCSATKWPSTVSQEGLSCIQLLTEMKNPGVTANLEIIQATSIFPINKGKGTNMTTLTGENVYYNDNGNAGELIEFLENTVLGGYEVSGVKVVVSIDRDSEEYTVTYEGLTALKPPQIESQTSSFAMQFKFTSSAPDLQSIFTPWRQWLNPNQN